MISHSIYCQLAEEIWNTVQMRYQSIENYVDEGEYTEYYSSGYPHQNTTYSLAIDSNQNVYHDLQRIGTDESWSYTFTYKKSAGESEGVFTKKTIKGTETMLHTLPFACYGMDGVLQEIAQPMLPDFFAAEIQADRTSEYRNYSLARRLDTLINSDNFYVIDRYSSYMLTQKGDKNEYNKDSLPDLHQSQGVPIS